MADFSKAKGNKTLQSVASKSALMKAGAVVKQLPVKELKDNPDNAYLFGMEQSDIEHTALGIKVNGFKGAINVYSCPDGTYEVYSGHIRKYAAIEAGLETIPCLVEPEPEETVKRRQLLGANLYGRNKVQSDNPMLVARQIHYHRETLEKEGFKGDTREQIAVDFRISASQVYKYESLLKLEPELQKIVAERKAPWSYLYNAKALSREEQEQLATMICEAAEKEREAVTKRALKDFMNSILSKKPLDGQLSIEDYEGVHREHPTEEQEEYEDCMFNNNPEEGVYECHPENGEHMCYGEEEEDEQIEDAESVHGEQVRIPSGSLVLKVYKMIGCEIKNYYELKEHLIKSFGKSYGGGAREGIMYQCSPRGIRLNSYDEITWTMFLDILSEQVQLDKTKQTETSEEASGVVSKSDLEKRIYKLKEELSNADSIQWSNAEDAKKIIKSLIAMLEDEVDAIG